MGNQDKSGQVTIKNENQQLIIETNCCSLDTIAMLTHASAFTYLTGLSESFSEEAISRFVNESFLNATKIFKQAKEKEATIISKSDYPKLKKGGFTFSKLDEQGRVIETFTTSETKANTE